MKEAPLDQFPNPYAAPDADVAPRRARAGATEGLPWFPVGTRKLLVMALFTFGLYPLYWFERQYRFQKRLHGESTMPLARATFSVFFVHELFRRVEGQATRAEVHASWSAGGMGTLFVASAVSSRILDTVGDKLLTGKASTVAGALSIALLYGMVHPLVRVQDTMNRLLALERPDFDRNDRFTVWNWIALLIGGVVLLLILAGLLMKDVALPEE